MNDRRDGDRHQLGVRWWRPEAAEERQRV